MTITITITIGAHWDKVRAAAKCGQNALLFGVTLWCVQENWVGRVNSSSALFHDDCH